MNINNILSSYSVGGIFSNYDVAETRNSLEKDFKSNFGTDSYSVSGKLGMSSEMYNYETKSINLAKVKNEVNNIENQNDESIEGGGGGSGSSSEDDEATTETETKVINGQVYMVITTTNEDGTKSVQNIKLGGNVSSDEDDSQYNTSDLAEAITM